jgi:hypothetical protein
MKRHRRRRCDHCKRMYEPDPRNRRRQEYCSAPACQRTSKVASQRRWRRSPKGCDYFRGPIQVDRVRKWRKAHPWYWRKPSKTQSPLQDILLTQPVITTGDGHILNVSNLVASVISPTPSTSAAADFRAPKALALQDAMSAQFTLMVGVMAHLSGALQDEMAPLLRRVFLLGQQVQGLAWGQTHGCDQTSALSGAVAQNPAAIQLDRPSSGAG